MKKHLSLILLIFYYIYPSFGQVGVGTNDIESGIILKVESKPNSTSTFNGGILLPKLNLTDIKIYLPATGAPIDGLLIYNTASTTGLNAISPGFYYWDANLSSWDDIYNPIKNDICKYTNQDTTTDFNEGISYMDLFANFVENENTSLFQKVNVTTMRITSTGLYKVILNLDMKIGQSGQDRDVFGVGLYVNGTLASNQLVVMTNERASDMSQVIGKTATFFITIPEGGGELRARGYEIHGASRVYFSAPKTSSISIERVR